MQRHRRKSMLPGEPLAEALAATSFTEAVRRRPAMMLGFDRDDPSLITSLLAAVVADALTDRGGGPPEVTVVIETDLIFSVTDTDDTRPLDETGRLRFSLYDTLLDNRRWPLAATAALANHTHLDVTSGGICWRQEFKQLEPTTLERVPADRPTGTHASFELDSDYFVPTAALPHEPSGLLSHWARAANIPPLGRLSFIDLR